MTENFERPDVEAEACRSYMMEYHRLTQHDPLFLRSDDNAQLWTSIYFKGYLSSNTLHAVLILSS